MAETKLMQNHIQIPSGTSGERPTGETGLLRHNSTTGYIEYWVASANNWLGIGQFSASGGTETTSGGQNVHTYTSGGTFSVFAGSKTATIDLLGGGGGGFSGNGQWAGGGGGGGFARVTFQLTPGTYNIGIGGGGPGGTGCPSGGGNGGTTNFATSLYAYGGSGAPDYPGGSGGGTSLTGQVSTIYNQSGGNGSPGQNGNGAGGPNGYYQAGLGNAYGSGAPAVPNFTPGIHATGYGNGGGGGPSCQGGHRGGGNGTGGFLILKYTP
jgi:hypothetical protein